MNEEWDEEEEIVPRPTFPEMVSREMIQRFMYTPK